MVSSASVPVLTRLGPRFEQPVIILARPSVRIGRGVARLTPLPQYRVSASTPTPASE
jgi:hypothetical protein